MRGTSIGNGFGLHRDLWAWTTSPLASHNLHTRGNDALQLSSLGIAEKTYRSHWADKCIAKHNPRSGRLLADKVVGAYDDVPSLSIPASRLKFYLGSILEQHKH
ncbi:hypothetical protein J3458_003486 [Metarhizium acridum]|uniref:uncharacterized protein n=1 Tax=Metarhizium acridum TaxID=92637 RepID=UPI001C6AF627|nr:hypothetical protein J3458_003486 [Metarhizium acridum]